MRWYVGSDHGGVALRDRLVARLYERGDEVGLVAGPAEASDKRDYPDVAMEVCDRVLADPGSFALLVCGTGQGMAMSANRRRGIRAALVGDVFSARLAREHNDANAVCMGERVTGLGLGVDLLDAFASASFEGGRHARRVAKIEAIEPGDGGPGRTDGS